MTALATVVGLLPIALKLGEGSEASAPLARAAVGGLTVSTVLTLVLVPAVYELLYARRERRGMRRTMEALALLCGAALLGSARRLRRSRADPASASRRRRRSPSCRPQRADVVRVDHPARRPRRVLRGDPVRQGDRLSQAASTSTRAIRSTQGTGACRDRGAGAANRSSSARGRNLEIRRVTYERLEACLEHATSVWSLARTSTSRRASFSRQRPRSEELEAMFSYTHIVAPFDGVVTGTLRRSRRADSGQRTRPASRG